MKRLLVVAVLFLVAIAVLGFYRDVLVQRELESEAY